MSIQLGTIPSRIRERLGNRVCPSYSVSRDTIERNVLQPMREIYGSGLIGTINNRNVARICGEDTYCLGAEKGEPGWPKVQERPSNTPTEMRDCQVEPGSILRCLNPGWTNHTAVLTAHANPENPTHWLKEFHRLGCRYLSATI